MRARLLPRDWSGIRRARRPASARARCIGCRRPIDVVMLHEHGCRQHNIGHSSSLGHELLVHADEQIVARKAALDRILIGRDRDRIGVLDQQRRHRRPAEQRVRLAFQDCADARLIEHAHLRIEVIDRLDDVLVPVKDRSVIVESAAAFVAPGAGDGGNATRRMHVDGAVARAGKAVAEPKEGALVGGDEPCKFLDRLHRTSGDGRGPLRRPRLHMRLQFARHVGVAVEIIPVGGAVAEQAMHHRTGQRAVGAGLDQHREIGLLHGAVLM